MSAPSSDINMTTSTDAFKRVDRLWWEDGNLIIIAGNKAFRVYKGILASRSTVFADTISMPQPEDSEKMDGCQVVRLTDDENEVEDFLLALLDYTHFSVEPFAKIKAPKPSLETVVGVLRLSHKYGAERMRRRALRHLTKCFPTTLKDYFNHLNNVPFEADLEAMDKIAIIKVAREVDAPWLLPATLYTLARYHPVQDLVDENSVPFQDSSFRAAYIQGETAQKFSYNRILKFLAHRTNRPGCKSDESCSQARYKMQSSLGIYENDGTAVKWNSPLEVWSSDHWKALKLCAECMKSAKEEHQNAKIEFWRRLPEMYSLPSWDVLEKRMIESLEEPKNQSQAEIPTESEST